MTTYSKTNLKQAKTIKLSLLAAFKKSINEQMNTTKDYHIHALEEKESIVMKAIKDVTKSTGLERAIVEHFFDIANDIDTYNDVWFFEYPDSACSRTLHEGQLVAPKNEEVAEILGFKPLSPIRSMFSALCFS